MSMVINPYRFGGGGGTWNPSNLAVPPKFWVNDSSSVLDAGAGACSQWNDISSSGYNLTQASGTNRPLIVAAAQNGRRIIRFDGLDNYMNNSGAGAKDLFRNTSAAWAMVVVKKAALDGVATNRNIIMGSTPTAGSARFLVSIGSTSGANRPRLAVRRLDADSAGLVTAASAVDTNYHMLLTIADWANGDGFIWKDGALTDSNTSMTTSGSTSNTAANDPFTVGAGSDSIAGPADVDLAEAIIGTGSLPDSTEIDKLFGYAAHRWGLASLLDVSHPYKSAPP